MKVMKLNFRALLGLCLFVFCTLVAQAQNPNQECPPNTSSIWIFREEYADPLIGPHSVQLAFSEGETWDQFEERYITNYLAGVLEAEMGGTRETPLNDWHEEAAKAVTVAVRTVAYDWCGTITVYDLDGTPHLGVDDSSRQNYWPGHAEERAEEYREFVLKTAGQYLTVDDEVFALQYRKYVGQETNEGQINPPHKSIKDPVGSPDEDNGTGMGFHSAQHWAEGRHNKVGCESSPNPNVNVGCHISQPPPSQWRSNLVWDYRRILAHYYSQIEFRGFPTYMPTEYRWNMLTTSLDQRSILPTDTTIPVTVQIQNSSTESYRTTSSTRRYELTYTLLPNGSQTSPSFEPPSSESGDCPSVPEPEGTVRLALPLEPGADQTVKISLSTPSELGEYILQWDMRRQEKFPKLGWCWIIFSQNRWPKQEQQFVIVRFSHHLYLPTITNQTSTQ